MTPIKIKTIDSKIWHPEKVAIRLTKALQQGPVTVDLLSEGPCCQDTGIDNLLEYICKGFNFDDDMINIQTSNQIASSKFKETRLGLVELDFCKSFAQDNPYAYTLPNKKFGMFVSRSNWKRLALAAYLWKNYRDESCVTFHFDRTSDYHRANFGLEQLVLEESLYYYIGDFLDQLPITFEKHSYPIQYNNGALDLAAQYRDIFCDIVCETYFTGRTFFITEKTWRPMIYRRPFIVQGPQWYLKNLRKLGFKTFSDWWSEGYDEDINGGTIDSIRNCIDFIAGQPQKKINQWLEEMQPTLDHNFFTLCNLTNQQILSIQFYASQPG